MKIKSISKTILTEPKQYYDVINANPYNNFLIKTNSSYVCSHNCFFDEISFIANKSIEEQKQKAIDMIDTAIGGMKTRFTNNGKNPTVLVLASSKRSDKSFLEVHTKKKLEHDGANTLVVDEPVWNVRPPSEYSGKRFWVAQGNRFLASEVVPENADLKPYKDKGYKMLEVPIEYEANFKEDIDRALCDFAGVSSSDLTKYIAGSRLQAVKNLNRKNPFYRDVIEVGNAPNDNTQYSDFFDLTQIDPIMKYKPLFIHLDMSVSGDKTGIAGVWIAGKKPPVEGQPASKELYFKLAFSVSVKAPRGYQVSFEKNRQFIYWLKEQGFNIRMISSDSFQSTDLAQQLIAKGYNYKMLSVDIVDSRSKICLPYHYLRSTIYEERIDMYDCELLTEELLGLERDSNGKIDHTVDGINSKDMSDAVCGATYMASQFGEEFAYDFGETTDMLLNANSESGTNEYIKQFSSDLLNSLQGDTNTVDRNKPAVNAPKPPMTSADIAKSFDRALDDGILIW